MTDEDDSRADRNDLPVFPSQSHQSAPHIEPLSHAVVRGVADALEKDVIDLPPLNNVIDAGALNTLVQTDRQHAEEWPTVRFSYVDHLVTITNSGDVTLSRQEDVKPAITDIKPDWPHVTPVSDSADDHFTGDLATKVVLAVADRSDHDPAYVRQEIDKILDRSSLERLNSTRADGTARAGATIQFSTLGYDVLIEPDGTVDIGSALQRLQLTGANILLVGAVPDSVMDIASVQLLGDGDRHRLFALLERHVDSAIDRLSNVDNNSGTARVIDYTTVARSAAESRSVTERRVDTDAPSDSGPDTRSDTTANIPAEDQSDSLDESEEDSARDFEDLSAVTIETVDGTIEAFVDVIEATIEDIQKRQPDPTELRFCFDSLRPLLEKHGVDGTRSILEPICERVTAVSGIGHYSFPIERDSEQVRALEPLFDATIEVRIDGGEPAQRWHLQRSNYTTEWFRLRAD